VNGERPVWAATHVGRVRTLNEDGCLVGSWRSEGPSASWRGIMPTGRSWAVVADGMGGHGAGDVASGVALNTIARLIRTATTEVHITRMLDAANQSLFEAMYGGDGRPGMGTTVVGVVLIGAKALIFNIGDSRAYSVDESRLLQQVVTTHRMCRTRGDHAEVMLSPSPLEEPSAVILWNRT
jgi:PPM family protein phosphatase